jgi:hypothetical protein
MITADRSGQRNLGRDATEDRRVLTRGQRRPFISSSGLRAEFRMSPKILEMNLIVINHLQCRATSIAQT